MGLNKQVSTFHLKLGLEPKASEMRNKCVTPQITKPLEVNNVDMT